MKSHAETGRESLHVWRIWRSVECHPALRQEPSIFFADPIPGSLVVIIFILCQYQILYCVRTQGLYRECGHRCRSRVFQSASLVKFSADFRPNRDVSCTLRNSHTYSLMTELLS